MIVDKAVGSMKKTRGASYIEIIVAMALFAIAMIAIIPTLTQAARNMTFAQEAYAGHLQAQRVMLVVRDALSQNQNPSARAMAYVSDGFEFSFWVHGVGGHEFHSPGAPTGPGAVSQILGLNTTMANHSLVIVTVVWSGDGQLLGRAIGVLYQ